MKSTGIVRRIDDLGRIVIPKEIRRTMSIHEGDPLEIFTNGEGGVTFKRYFPEAQYADQLKGIRNDIADDMDIKPDIRQSLVSGLDSAIKALEGEHD